MTSKNNLGLDDFKMYSVKIRGDRLHFIVQALELLDYNLNNNMIKSELIQSWKKLA